jgi:hypothetical protein
VGGLQANANEGSFASGRRAPTFLCYHGLTFHNNRVNTEASRGEAVNFRPGGPFS